MTRSRQRPSVTTRLGAAVIAALFVCVSVPRAETPEDIHLTAPNGSLTLTGRFVGYDGEVVTLTTEDGVLSLRLAGLTCTGEACPDRPDYVPRLRFAGGTRMANMLLPALAAAYARDIGGQLVNNSDSMIAIYDASGPVLRLSVASVGTEAGFHQLQRHQTDVLMAMRELDPVELDIARAAGLGQLDARGQSLILALDAMVPVAAPGTDVKRISLIDLADLLAGDITDWAELGGVASPIVLHLPEAGEGQVEALVARLLAPSGRTLRDDIVRHADVAALTAAVEKDYLALGLVPAGAVGPAQALALSGPCGLQMTARDRTLRTEDYPLTFPLLLYRPERRLDPEAERFLDWMRQPSAQLVVRRSGLVDPAPVPIPVTAQGVRLSNAILSAGPEVPLAELQRMAMAFRGRERLSTTFRFEAGSTRFDAVSRAGIMQFAQAIQDGRYRGKQLILIGFSDGLGPADANRDLARARAEAVRREVIAALGGALPEHVGLEVEAFGEALPIACDDTIWGQQANRRVELWLGDLP